MPIWVLVLLALAAFLTSIVSAILGMAGGVMLLAVMLVFLSHSEAIPTHATVQIASNGTRLLAFIRNVDREAFARFAIGVVPGGAIGLWLLWALGEPDESEPYLKALIGAYILAATFIGKPPGGQKIPGKWWDFPLMGLAAGSAALTVGAVGPLIAPLFARRDFVKERLIATKAICQLSTHVMKIPAFLVLRDLNVSQLGLLAAVMVVMVVPGTLLGKRVLVRHVSEHQFRVWFRVALTLAGSKVLIVDGLIPIANRWSD